MDAILKTLLSNKLFSEETKEEVVKAFKLALEEAKEAQEKAIRKELSERYEQDKGAIHMALEQYLEQELSEHVKEFRRGITEVEQMKKTYADKIVEVKSAAKKYVSSRLGAVEKVLESILAKELKEVHEDEVANRRAYLKAITEAKAGAEAERTKFRETAAAVLENIVNVQVESTLTELREDIKAARESDFGRELFESFYTTFRRQFFNSSTEFRNLVEQKKKADSEATRVKRVAKKKVAEAKKHATAAVLHAKKITEAHQRAKTMATLLGRLKGPAREKMHTILDVTETTKLERTFKKFLPELLAEHRKSPEKRRQRKIDEAALELRTGGKAPIVEAEEDDDEILEIKRRAGNL